MIARKFIVGQGIAEFHIIRATALYQHIRFGDSIRLGIEFLTIASDICVFVNRFQTLGHTSEHLACTHCHIVNGFRNPLFFKRLSIFANQKVGHKIDNISCGEVRPCFFVITFGKFPYEFLEDIAHILRRNDIRAEIRFFRTKFLQHDVERATVVHFRDFVIEVEMIDNVNNVRGKFLQVFTQVRIEIIGVFQNVFKGKFTGIIEQ